MGILEDNKIIFNELIVSWLKNSKGVLKLTSYEKFKSDSVMKAILEYKKTIAKNLPELDEIALMTSRKKRTDITTRVLHHLFGNFKEYSVTAFEEVGEMDVFIVRLTYDKLSDNLLERFVVLNGNTLSSGIANYVELLSLGNNESRSCQATRDISPATKEQPEQKRRGPKPGTKRGPYKKKNT